MDFSIPLSCSLSVLWRWAPSTLHPVTFSGSEELHPVSVSVPVSSLCQQRLLAALGVSTSEVSSVCVPEDFHWAGWNLKRGLRGGGMDLTELVCGMFDSKIALVY